MKFSFSQASGLMPTWPLQCAVGAAGDSSAFSSIGCYPMFNTDPYIVVTGLVSNKFQYIVEISSIVNAPTSKLVTDIFCEFCADQGCTQIVEPGDATQITFKADVLREEDISIRSTNPLNGETDSTLEFGILLGNKLVTDATVVIDLPKQNYWFFSLGAPNRDCLIQNCDGLNMTVTAAWADGDVALVEYPIPLNAGANCIADMSTVTPGACLIPEFQDILHDRLQINLQNTQEILANRHLRIKLYPVRNPPSLAPLTTFRGWTSDSTYNEIETFENIKMDTTLPNEFSSGSAKAIGFTTGSLSDPSIILSTDVIYEFEIYTQYNDIPNYSMITVGWPQDWPLDCSLTYTTVCTDGCDVNQTICNQASQRLELMNGFDPTGLFPYIQYQVGKIKFTISGITNPSSDVDKYFTVTTWHNHTGTNYEIDSSYTMFLVNFDTGSIVINEIRPNSSMIYTSDGTYYFSFTPQHDILTDMILTIDMPVEVQVQQNAACIIHEITGKTQIAAFYTCKADANNNRFTLTNFLMFSTTAGDVIEFYLDSIRNPGDFINLGQVFMQITTTLGGQIDSGYYTNWASGDTLFSSSFIQDFKVEPVDQVAGTTGASYKFFLNPHSRVAQGAILILDLPKEIQISNPTGLQRGCNKGDISGFSYSVLGCVYNQPTHQVILRNGYKFANSVGDPPEVYFSLTNFRNPRSTAVTSMFNITIYNTQSKGLFYFNQSDGPIVQMTEVPSPKAISYERSSRINGMNSNQSWYIVNYNLYLEGDLITFELPRGIRFTDDSKALALSSNIELLTKPIFSIDMQSMSIELTVKNGEGGLRTQIDGGSILQILLTNVTSPSSFRPLADQIHYKVTDVDGYEIETDVGGLEVQNAFQGDLNPNRAGIIPDYWDNKVLANYTLGFEFLNFEQNLQIWITVPPEIQIPTEEENGPLKCRGIKGTDRANLTCFVFYENSTIFIVDAVTSKEVAPAQIEIMLEQLRNPNESVITSSFILETRTYDGYPMDKLDQNLTVNFYCLFPCRDCQEDTPQKCESCYITTSSFRYLWDEDCLEQCPNTMFIINEDSGIPSCDYCEFPCQNCGNNATHCTSCYPGWTFYEEESYCYEQIEWWFPFLIASGIAFMIVFAADYHKKSTNFLHSLLYFLCWIEDAVIAYLILLWLNREVKGDRSLTIISVGVQVVLNVTFAAVHCKFMSEKASVENQQLFSKFPVSTYFFSFMSYILNFKSSVILVSQFAGLPRFSGRLNRDAWQKFNIFAMLYICLVYLPFITDFYLYFTANGLRKKTSFVAAEASLIRTIISLILMLEVLAQCACSGLAEQDLEQRANLGKGKKGKKGKKRKALRSGMGNEAEYGDYESEEESWDEELAQIALREEGIIEHDYDIEVMVEEEDSEESKDEVFEQVQIKPKIRKSKNETPGPQKTQLEELALQMQEEKRLLEQEQKKILQEKIRILEEKEKYLDEFTNETNISKQLDEHRQLIQDDLEKTKNDVDQQIMQKLLQRDAKAADKNAPLIVLPQPVMAEVEYSRSVEGDEEYWMQNTSAINDEISNNDLNKTREKDGSVIEFIQNEDARKSNIGSLREMEADEEMRAGMTDAGGVHGTDLSAKKSYIGTEQEFLNRSAANFGQDDGTREKIGTEQDYYDGASAVFSNATGPNALSKIGTEQNFVNKSQAEYGPVTPINKSDNLEGLNNLSADFGDNSLAMDKSVKGITPKVDQVGHSDESNEDIVADHKPFNGITEAMAKQDEMRKSDIGRSNRQQDISNDIFDAQSGTTHTPINAKGAKDLERSVFSVEEDEDDDRPSARRHIKQVLYSDKSESSFDDMMDDTPSNYNIANGRLEGKSMGLKAILLFAKKQGQIGAANQNKANLPQIQEESNLSPNQVDYGGEWKAMNNPIAAGSQRARTQIADMSEMNSRTIDDGQKKQGGKSKRNPGSKQFVEPDEDHDLAKIKSNNFV